MSLQYGSAGGDDSLMLSGQSRIDTFSQHQMDSGVSDPGSSSSSASSNSYDNHNMAASSSAADQYYRSVGTRRSSSPTANSGHNYRVSHQSRNFYPAIDGDVPEPLPMPMAVQQSAVEHAGSALPGCITNSSGVNCVQGSVPSADRVDNGQQTAPLAS